MISRSFNSNADSQHGSESGSGSIDFSVARYLENLIDIRGHMRTMFDNLLKQHERSKQANSHAHSETRLEVARSSSTRASDMLTVWQDDISAILEAVAPSTS